LKTALRRIGDADDPFADALLALSWCDLEAKNDHCVRVILAIWHVRVVRVTGLPNG
jgi:hypothetical protein